VAQSIKRGGAKHTVAWEGVSPFVQIKIGISYLELVLCYGKAMFCWRDTLGVLKRGHAGLSTGPPHAPL